MARDGRFMKMLVTATHSIVVLLIVTTVAVGQAQKGKQFERVDVFPDGKQTNLGKTLAKIWTNPHMTNTESFTFNASDAKVWKEAKKAAQYFVRSGKRPIKIDEAMLRIYHSNVEEALKRNEARLITTTWLDEVVIEVTPLSDTQTKVTITRKVLEAKTGTNGQIAWSPVGSNGRIERWLLTLIQDGIGRPKGSAGKQGNPVSTNTFKTNKSVAGQVVESNFFVFELKTCRISGTSVVCELKVTNNGEDSEFGINARGTRMFDNQGGQYQPSSITVGTRNTGGLRNKNYLVKGVSAGVKIIFDRVSTSATGIALLTFRCSGGNPSRDFDMKFRNLSFSNVAFTIQ